MPGSEDFLSETEMLGIVGQVGGYAVGRYVCKCPRCNRRFMGDKRAMECLVCAIERLQKSMEQALNEANNKSPLELVRRAISLKMQFKEFGRTEVDEVEGEVFVMDNQHRENFADATKAASIAVLEALAECELPAEVVSAASHKITIKEMFKTICMALIAEAESKNEAKEPPTT